MPQVDVIIVNWNTGGWLARCLKSLLALPEHEQKLLERIVVVDNASQDDSLFRGKEAAGANEKVFFIEMKHNLGFASGNNTALRTLNLRNHVLLLNPDTEVRSGAITALLAVLNERQDVGIVGPKLLNEDGSVQGSVRPFPNFGDFLMYMLKLGRVVQSRQEAAHDYARAGYVDQVMGAAFLIRAETLQTVGQLDEKFFTLFEEVDYCKRANAAGWKTYFTPAGEIVHARAASFNQLVGLQRTWPWMMSSLHYAHKHLGKLAWLCLVGLTPLTAALSLPASLKHLWLKEKNHERL